MGRGRALCLVQAFCWALNHLHFFPDLQLRGGSHRSRPHAVSPGSPSSRGAGTGRALPLLPRLHPGAWEPLPGLGAAPALPLPRHCPAGGKHKPCGDGAICGCHGGFRCWVVAELWGLLHPRNFPSPGSTRNSLQGRSEPLPGTHLLGQCHLKLSLWGKGSLSLGRAVLRLRHHGSGS